MTVECLKNALALIENYFGRPLSTDERTARSQIYAAALKDIPDDVAAAALTKALTVCRYQNQLLVDWCAEIRKLQSAGQPTANDLWTQAIVAARKIERNQYYATHGGLVTATGKLTAEDFRAENRSIFGALPAAVREWAGSPAGLVDALDRSNADLLQYVKPGFVKAVDLYRRTSRQYERPHSERRTSAGKFSYCRRCGCRERMRNRGWSGEVLLQGNPRRRHFHLHHSVWQGRGWRE